MLKVRIAGKAAAGFNKLEKNIQSMLDDVKDKTIQVVKANTPKRSGRARNNWSGKNTRKGFEVKNSTPYIGVLNKGSSKQAPTGIIKPTVGKLTGYIKSRRLSR